MLVFDQFAAVLVSAWFLAGVWLVVASFRQPRSAAAAPDGDAARLRGR